LLNNLFFICVNLWTFSSIPYPRCIAQTYLFSLIRRKEKPQRTQREDAENAEEEEGESGFFPPSSLCVLCGFSSNQSE
jgi:hypothetical protein